MFYNAILGIIIGFILFTIYVYFYVDGIIFRPNSEGETVFTPANLFDLAICPLRNIYFWKPEMWTANFFIYVVSSTIAVYVYKNENIFKIISEQ
jgi:hypothetical protein